MSKFWLTSDTHYGHGNIITYTNRPFKSLEEMDYKLIKNHNSLVSPEDTVFFLGDFCFRNSPGGKQGEGTTNKAEFYLKQLNGNFIFIKGNHDSGNGVNAIIDYCSITYFGHNFFLTHIPSNCPHNFKLCICGHVHDRWTFKREHGTDFINVGVDVWDFRPITFQTMWKKYSNWIKSGRKQE